MRLYKNNTFFITQAGYQLGIEMSDSFGWVYIHNRQYIGYETRGLLSEGKGFYI